MMSIEFHCDDCSKLLRVADGLSGKRCKCPSCGKILTVPTKPVPESAPVEETDEESIELKIEIPCPKCQSVLLYTPEMEGTRGLCKACKHIFTISVHNQSPTAPSDTFAFQCPKCNFLFEGKDGTQGRKGKCSECKEVFVITPLPKEKKERKPSSSQSPSQQTRNTPVVANDNFKPQLFNPLGKRDSTPSSSTTKASPPTSRSAPTSPAHNTSVPSTPVQAIPVRPSNSPEKAVPATLVEAIPVQAIPVQSPIANDWTQAAPSSPGSWGSGYSTDYSNPYQTSVQATRDYGFTPAGAVSFGQCFSLTFRNFFAVMGFNLIPTFMAILILVLDIALIVGVIAILSLLEVRIAPDPSSFVMLIILFLVAYIAILGSMFIAIPSYWQYSLAGVRNQRLTVGLFNQGARWGGWLFLLYICLAIPTAIIRLLIQVGVTGRVSSEDGDPIRNLAVTVMTLLVAFMIYFPFGLVPVALADGKRFGESFSIAFRFMGKSFGVYLGISVLGFLGGFLSLFATGFVMALLAMSIHPIAGISVGVVLLIFSTVFTFTWIPSLHSAYYVSANKR